jgi:glycogen phosphorylase
MEKEWFVKTLGHVSVYPAPDSKINRLAELANNLWWSWNPAAQALYLDIDPLLWKRVNHNPVKFLRLVSQSRLDRAAANAGYLDRYHAVMAAFDAYMRPESGTTWWSRQHGDLGDRLIAYFSAEFGLHESLPIYSGGLGILAGDHCKTASDLGLPFVGVGFLYPQGYFQQRIDADGRQQAGYEKLNFAEVPATPALGPDGKQVVIHVDLPGRRIYAKVWCIQVGRIPIYLMDTDVEQNAPSDRELSARLYGGDHQMRISQEFVLGIGGVRALRALGLHPSVWHMNEGHAAFLQLERIREYVEDQGLPFDVALWSVRADSLFTTHTPVPAGNDSFAFDLMDRFFGEFWPRMDLEREQFLALGRYDYTWGPQFSMTVLALRTGGMANGVSKLHGEVSRRMWKDLYQGVPEPEVPIGHVTNGVHTDTWAHPGLTALLDRYLEPDWRDAIDERKTWAGVYNIPDDELWSFHQRAKVQMLGLVRERAALQLMRIGGEPAEVNMAAKALDPHALTIGFARRFATYKRATLLFRYPERLKRLLNDSQRPVQLIFSGKAHPADEPGKAFIQAVYQASKQPGFAGKIVFVEDYDTNIARHLVSGVDVWLNNPRRPLEASGTSGQKAGLNGIPNFSVLDGWWAEGYDGSNGWAVGAEREYPTESAQDEADVLSLFAILENEIVPLYYQRNEAGLPTGWLEQMRRSIATVAPDFSFDRMLKEYVRKFYLPLGELSQSAQADSFSGSRDLAAWDARVQAGWPQVQVEAVGPEHGEMTVGKPLVVRGTVTPGTLSVDDLVVELVCLRDEDGKLVEATALPMHRLSAEDGRYRYEGAFDVPESGAFVYGVRVRPNHPCLPNPFATALMTWA